VQIQRFLDQQVQQGLQVQQDQQVLQVQIQRFLDQQVQQGLQVQQDRQVQLVIQVQLALLELLERKE
jgi:hypothetical protein